MFSRRENRDAEDRHWRVRVERGDKVLIASISAGVVFLADDDVRLGAVIENGKASVGRLPCQAACQLPDQTDYYLGGTSLHW